MNFKNIFTAVTAKLRSLFTTKKTVGGIVASINKQVAQLQAVAKQSQLTASKLYAEADRIEDAANAAVDEAALAARVAGNLSRLTK